VRECVHTLSAMFFGLRVKSQTFWLSINGLQDVLLFPKAMSHVFKPILNDVLKDTHVLRDSNVVLRV
jgi:hypothetical protein